jgi:hypothetical protein
MSLKKSKKTVDTPLYIWDICPTHGNIITKNMRTKTLLIAAAALAATVISSQAQILSQNVVGFANQTNVANTTYLITIPFTVGVSNGANEVWPVVGGIGGTPTIPDSSTILLWNGGGYDTFLSDSFSASGWDDAGGNPIPNSPILPTGTGFFFIPFANTSYTVAGSVAVNIGTSNVVHLLANTTYLVSPKVPYGGFVTNGNPVTGAGGVGLSSINGLPDSSTLLIWTGSGYSTFLSDSFSTSLWDDAGGNPIPLPPSVSVMQGFFLIPFSNFDWKVGL